MRHEGLGIAKDGVVHICASPHLDLVAARDMKFRRIWIDGVTGALGDMAVDTTLRLDNADALSTYPQRQQQQKVA